MASIQGYLDSFTTETTIPVVVEPVIRPEDEIEGQLSNKEIYVATHAAADGFEFRGWVKGEVNIAKAEMKAVYGA